MKKMKKRTLFTIIAIVAIVGMGVVETWLVRNGQTLPDSFIDGWYKAWTVELALLWGIRVFSKGDSNS